MNEYITPVKNLEEVMTPFGKMKNHSYEPMQPQLHKHHAFSPRVQMYDKVMIERIKIDVAEWMNTHGQVMMGEESAPDVVKLIDESVERTLRIREDWILPDRC